jgi:hypothetical protein
MIPAASDGRPPVIASSRKYSGHVEMHRIADHSSAEKNGRRITTQAMISRATAATVTPTSMYRFLSGSVTGVPSALAPWAPGSSRVAWRRPRNDHVMVGEIASGRAA